MKKPLPLTPTMKASIAMFVDSFMVALPLHHNRTPQVIRDAIMDRLKSQQGDAQ